VLSAGTDPVKDFKTFAEEEGMWSKTEMISLQINDYNYLI
jgi:hypothetical protein